MPFSSLHTIELQLIYRACDQSSILCLARCCQFTLAAASAPFTWQLASPVTVCSLQPQLDSLLSKSLLRFASGVEVLFLADSADEVSVVAEVVRVTLIACPLIVRFDSLSFGSSLPIVLEHPAFSQLQSLKLVVTAGMGLHLHFAAPRLLSLRTLHLNLSGPVASAFELHRMPSLTSVCLDFERSHHNYLANITEQLRQCALLTRFCLVSHPLDLTLAVLLSQLTSVEELEFDRLDFDGGVFPAQWMRSFFSSPKLRSLSFTRTRHLSELVRYLSHNPAQPRPAFRQLTIQAEHHARMPDSALIRALLDRLPSSLDQLVFVWLTPRKGSRVRPEAYTSYQRVDPHIRVITKAHLPSHEERASELRKRFQQRTRGCIIS